MTDTSAAEGVGRRRRILLSTFTIDPSGGSESVVGWQRGIQGARFFDTWLICNEQDSRAATEEYFDVNGPVEGLEVVFVPTPKWAEILGRVPGFFYLSYNVWQRRALRVAAELDRDVGFDLMHQVNLVGYREPGYLWKLDVPFVWGPVGGTQNYPNRFLRQAGLIGGASEAVRTFLNHATMRWSRRVRQAASRAAALTAANTTVANDLERMLNTGHVEVMLETGAPPVASEIRSGSRTGPIRILWAGQLKPFKALPQLLDALADLPSTVDFELTVAGDGREMRSWRGRAERLGIGDRIQWLGWIEYDEMKQHYETADVFVFTSLRDTSGNVVLEAFAEGMPVVAPDHQGVGDMVNDECGILVPVTSHKEMVAAYRDAIIRLADDPDYLEQLGRGARRRAAHYSWDRQGERMRDVYDHVLNSSSGLTDESGAR